MYLWVMGSILRLVMRRLECHTLHLASATAGVSRAGARTWHQPPGGVGAKSGPFWEDIV